MRITLRRTALIAGLFFLFPAVAQAHSAGGALNGWHDGFSHPLHGWDHLLAMLAVGFWAAQQRGRAVWMLPLTFVMAMTLGGIAGAGGLNLPGVEGAILLSVFVLLALVAKGVRLRIGIGLALVGLFGFCHGFAHGHEMPASTSILTFACGFVLATLLLHGLGLLTARVVIVGLACIVGGSTFAQENTNATASTSGRESKDQEPVRLPPVTVTGRADSLIGIADSATQGTIGAQQLELRPAMRTGEILETVPGVIITQHAGGGKANQYFLRGFNLDHGTDFATFLDGMPLNLPTHGHGQGYSDMNVVIPELVQRVNYEKGVYYAENGDFASAGAAHLEFFKTLPGTLAIAEGGMYGYARGVFASSPRVGDGNLLYGIELYHDDGPWKRPDDYQKFNGILTYSQGDNANGFSITARGYHGKWNSSDQVAKSAVDDGLVPFFGSLDDSTGGHSQRYSLQAEWHRAGDRSATKVLAYGFYYDLNLFSDFTYFLVDTNRGDQFEQADRRWVAGLDASHELFNQWWGKDVQNTFGLQVRNDVIHNGLFQTADQQRVDKVDTTHRDFPLPATTRDDHILETSVGLYFENRVQWGERFRTVAGVRGDIFNFDVISSRVQNSDDVLSAIGSPKLSLIFGPWAKTEVYLQGGMGYHSNDGRGVTTRVDPVTGASTNLDGDSIKRGDALVQTYGAEIGVRTLALEGLQSTVSLWWLDIDSELVFAGDAGTTEASRPSRRYGVEWANYYNANRYLTLDADFSPMPSFEITLLIRVAVDPWVRKSPGPLKASSRPASPCTLHDWHGFFASLRLRYFGPRPLIEDNSFRSSETILLGAQFGYQINNHWRVTAELFNLLNRRDHDIDYAYESRVTPVSDAVTQIHFHPVEPIQARFGITATF